MSTPSTSDWLDAYLLLRRAASTLRGVAERVDEYDEIVRSPDTIGHDVIAIAALTDPHLRPHYSAFGGLAIAARWRALLDDLERHALPDPDRAYRENETFWRTLAAVYIFLHSVDAPGPDREQWENLVASIADGPPARNAGPTEADPFVPLAQVTTFSDLFLAQHRHLRELRGFDRATKPDPLGQIPRTTHDDVIKLADYWSRQLARTKEISGHARVVARWKVAMADVEQIARAGAPSAVYVNNEPFWFALRATAIYVSVANETPSKADLLFEAIKDNVTRLPENVVSGAKAIASAAGDAASGVASGVGKAINKGLLSGIGTPLLVGGGLLAAIWLSRRGAPSGKPV